MPVAQPLALRLVHPGPVSVNTGSGHAQDLDTHVRTPIFVAKLVRSLVSFALGLVGVVHVQARSSGSKDFPGGSMIGFGLF